MTTSAATEVTPGGSTRRSSSPVTAGDVLAGKYRVDRVLGEGGMGVVVAATHLQLEEPVALKFLLLDAALDDAAGRRFLREAQAAVKIKSEHVARVRDVGTLDGGRPFIVMEYLEGRDLAQVLHAEGPMLPAIVVSHVLQACEAIAEAHRAGVVHRDLKPSNLFLTRRGDGSSCVKVLDFGISKVLRANDADSATLTKGQTPMGTPAYMSPEQLRSARDVDARTDVWSLGAIMMELLTGAPPFPAESMADLCAMILMSPAPRCSARVAGIPPALDDIVVRCLQKSPDARFDSVLDLAAALRESLAPEDLASTQVVAQGGLRARASATTPRPVTPAASPRARATDETPSAASSDDADAAPPPRSAGGVMLRTAAFVVGASAIAFAGWLAWGRATSPATAPSEAARANPPASPAPTPSPAQRAGDAAPSVDLAAAPAATSGILPESTTSAAPVVPSTRPESAAAVASTPPLRTPAAPPRRNAASAPPARPSTTTGRVSEDFGGRQ